MKGMALNTNHVFFWNNFQIWYFDVADDIHKFYNIGLYVDPEDLLTKIKSVRTSSCDDLITIIVR